MEVKLAFFMDNIHHWKAASEFEGMMDAAHCVAQRIDARRLYFVLQTKTAFMI
jgi:hypothetical protein